MKLDIDPEARVTGNRPIFTAKITAWAKADKATKPVLLARIGTCIAELRRLRSMLAEVAQDIPHRDHAEGVDDFICHRCRLDAEMRR